MSSLPHHYCAQDPMKLWKQTPSLFTSLKATHLFTNVMKGFVAICLLASISLLSLAGFFKWFGCNECQQTIVRPIAGYASNVGLGYSHNETTNISHILFGISGSLKTWEDRRHYCEAWWKPQAMSGFIWLDEPPEGGSWPETSPPYRVSGDTSKFKYTCWYGSRAAVRIARIVKESFELGVENVRWFVMGDDDTVFFPENLVTVLSKYDHNELYYVGSVSESVEQDEVHSYTMAYGGAGFAISYALAAELVRILDGCIDRYASAYGSDQKIGGCMTEIGVQLTRELGFHQLDIRGNAYGLLAAHPVAPLVSLHHLDYLHPLFPQTSREQSVKKLVQAYNLDPNRMLQHSFCYDVKRKWSISISWGYTIQLYPLLVGAKELETPLQTFLTWKSWSEEPFTFNTRTLKMEPCQRPIIYYVDRVHHAGKGFTVSTYKKPIDYKKRCDKKEYVSASLVKSFNVSAQLLPPEIWKKAPRRQCCEVINGGDGEDGVVQVRIRGCNEGESVTPP